MQNHRLGGFSSVCGAQRALLTCSEPKALNCFPGDRTEANVRTISPRCPTPSHEQPSTAKFEPFKPLYDLTRSLKAKALKSTLLPAIWNSGPGILS